MVGLARSTRVARIYFRRLDGRPEDGVSFVYWRHSYSISNHLHLPRPFRITRLQATPSFRGAVWRMFSADRGSRGHSSFLKLAWGVPSEAGRIVPSCVLFRA